MFVPSGREHVAFPFYASRGVGYLNHGQPLPSESVLDTVLCSPSPCFTFPILIFIHLSSELFGLKEW